MLLQTREMKSIEKYTYCRFLYNEDMHVIETILVCRYAVLAPHQINFLTKKIELRYFYL